MRNQQAYGYFVLRCCEALHVLRWWRREILRHHVSLGWVCSTGPAEVGDVADSATLDLSKVCSLAESRSDVENLAFHRQQYIFFATFNDPFGSNHLYLGDYDDVAKWTYLDIYISGMATCFPPLLLSLLDDVIVALKIVRPHRDQYILSSPGVESRRTSINVPGNPAPPLVYDNKRIIYRSKALVEGAEVDKSLPAGLCPRISGWGCCVRRRGCGTVRTRTLGSCRKERVVMGILLHPRVWM